MRLRLVIIDEPVSLNEPSICRLWQETLWAKVASYKKHYNHNKLPIGVDDYFCAHLIIADESTGRLKPVMMFKSTPINRLKAHSVPNTLMQILKGTHLENSLPLTKIFNNKESLVDYSSAYTTNPVYREANYDEYKLLIKNLLTVICCNYYRHFNIQQWVSIAAKKYKVDHYFEYLGCKKVHEEFSVAASDFEPIQIYHNANAFDPPQRVQQVLESHSEYWDNAIVQSAHSEVKKNRILKKVA